MSKTLDEQLADARKVVQKCTTVRHPAVEAGCALGDIIAFEKICEGLERYVSRDRCETLMVKGLAIEITDVASGLIRYEAPLHQKERYTAWCQKTGRNTEG